MTVQHGGTSIRTRFLLVLLVGAVLPLASIGAWLALSSERAGEMLLRSQLQESLATQAADISGRWRFVQADLLLLADNDVIWRILADTTEPQRAVPPFVLTSFRQAPSWIEGLRYTDSGGRNRITLSAADRAPARGSDDSITDLAVSPEMVEITLPVHDSAWLVVGQLTAVVHLRALLQAQPAPRLIDAVFAVRDTRTGRLLLGEAAAPVGSAQRFQRDGSTWIGASLALDGPPLELRLAAPLDPVVAPFARTARSGAILLVLAALGVVMVTTHLTARMTKPIVATARAAEAIAAGDMEQSVPEDGAGEIGRLGRAFNAMARSLRDTLDALAVQRTQAALGEFATSLTHEVRNAHTTIGLDLQRVIRAISDRPAERAMLERSLRRVQSIDRVVEGALRVARSGRVTFDQIDLRDVIGEAVRAAGPWFEERQALLTTKELPRHPISISGDAAALETLLLNLLRNAAQAMAPGGRAEVSLAEVGSFAHIEVRDDGVGMSPDQLATAFQLFVTSRPDGNGLGLGIARQIAIAHGSDIQIESAPGAGTVCRVRFATLATTPGSDRS